MKHKQNTGREGGGTSRFGHKGCHQFIFPKLTDDAADKISRFQKIKTFVVYILG